MSDDYEAVLSGLEDRVNKLCAENSLLRGIAAPETVERYLRHRREGRQWSAHMSTDAGQLEYTQEELDRVRKELKTAKQSLVNERQMWQQAIGIVVKNPADLRLIGTPDKPNEIRESLRPLAESPARILTGEVGPEQG